MQLMWHVVKFAKYHVNSICLCFFFQAEDGIRDLVRSRGLGDVYKRQVIICVRLDSKLPKAWVSSASLMDLFECAARVSCSCLLYTSDAADERSSVDLVGRRIIKKKNKSINRDQREYP